VIRKLVINDGGTERELLLVGTIVVGRDPACHISDLDPLLSRRHAELVTTAQGVTIRDLASRNGVLVNGNKVQERVLAGGDLIQLGHMQLRYLEDRAPQTRDAHLLARATTDAVMDSATMAVPPPVHHLPQSEHHAAQPFGSSAQRPAPDHDVTRMPLGGEPAAAGASSTDLNATVAPRNATVAPRSNALDSPVAPDQRELDATVAPGTDFDATLLSGHLPALPIHEAIGGGADASLVAGDDLRVRSANAECRHWFGTSPDALVGQSVLDLVARSLQALAAGDGPPSLWLRLERTPTAITMTVKAGQTVETAS
jgi:hypothetical protein